MRSDRTATLNRTLLYPFYCIVSALASSHILRKTLRKHKLKLGILILLLSRSQSGSGQNLRTLATCYLTRARNALDKSTIEASSGTDLSKYSFGLKYGRILNVVYDFDITFGLQSEYLITPNQRIVYGGGFIRYNHLGYIRFKDREVEASENKGKRRSLTYDSFVEAGYNHSFTKTNTGTEVSGTNYSSFSDVGAGLLFRIGRTSSMVGLYVPCRVYSPFSRATWTCYPQVRYVYQFWSLVKL